MIRRFACLAHLYGSKHVILKSVFFFFTLASCPCGVSRWRISFKQSSFIYRAHPEAFQSAHIEKWKTRQNVRIETGLPTSHLESEILICSHVHHVANLQVDTGQKFGFSKNTPLFKNVLCSEPVAVWSTFRHRFTTRCSQTPQPECADKRTLVMQGQDPSCRAALWQTYKAIFCDVGWQSADESPVIGGRTSETETNRCRRLSKLDFKSCWGMRTGWQCRLRNDFDFFFAFQEVVDDLVKVDFLLEKKKREVGQTSRMVWLFFFLRTWGNEQIGTLPSGVLGPL